mgnify:CR=1
EKCLVSQVIVAVVAVKTRILTAFCQLEFVCLSLRNNYYCNFDEPSENYSRNLRLRIFMIEARDFESVKFRMPWNRQSSNFFLIRLD